MVLIGPEGGFNTSGSQVLSVDFGSFMRSSSSSWSEIDASTPLLLGLDHKKQEEREELFKPEPIYGNKFRMISGDVLTSGMTELRTKHLDQFHLKMDAAPIGTCPIESQPPTSSYPSSSSSSPLPLNITYSKLLDTAEERLYHEASSLYGDVAAQVASGQLVDWSIQQRGLMFAAQKVGAVLGDVPLSRISLAYGPKLMISIGIGSSALRALFLPFVAGHTPFWFTFSFELIMGLLGEAIVCNLYPMTASWFVPGEASAFIACFHLSYILGPTLTNLISTRLLSHSASWRWCFYLGGYILTVMTILWLIVGADRPEKSRFISKQELQILQNSVTNVSVSRQLDFNALGSERRCICSNPLAPCPAKEMKRVPKWATIVKCPTVWALVVTNFACYWNTNTGTLWPTYFSNILHWDASTIGLITSFRGFLGLIYGAAFAYGTRKLAINRPFNMSLAGFRKLCQLLATLTLSVSLFLMIVYDCSMLANSVAIMITPIVNSFNVISFYQVPLDISPEDSGLISAFVRSLAFGDVIASPVSSYILSFASGPSSVAGDRYTWRLVWMLTLALKLVACAWFALFAKCESKSYSRVEPAGVCKSRLQHDHEYCERNAY